MVRNQGIMIASYHLQADEDYKDTCKNIQYTKANRGTMQMCMKGCPFYAQHVHKCSC